MKQVIIILALFFTSQLVIGQGKYESGMQKAIDQMNTAKTAEDMLTASALFERIADAEKDKWLPYYYAAYANHLSGWMNTKADKDKVAEKSKDLLFKAETLDRNSETFCLRQMIAIQQMMVDPMSRYQSYGAEATKALEEAKKLDANNPRIYMLEGQTLMNTPEAFGGGKKVAKSLFEKSVALYETFKPASAFHPNWGKAETAKLLAACQ
jgi:hypothetical protein